MEEKGLRVNAGNTKVEHLYLTAANFSSFYIWTFCRIYILTDFKFSKKTPSDFW